MQADKIWQAALGELQLQVSKANYNTWLKDTRGLDYSDGQFTVAVPSTFISEWLKSRLYSLVCRIVSGIVGQNTTVCFQVQAVNGPPPAVRANPMPDGGVSLKTRDSANRSNYLNPRYSFANFVTGDCNRFPLTAAVEIAGNPGELFNPFFVYGGTGTGKTHLLHAIGHAARAAGLSTYYVSAEQFTNEFVVAIRSKKAEEFRSKFSNVDVLLLDDIQFLSGKTGIQECMFHILNDFLGDNRQIVISSDRPPKEIQDFNVRLRSRLEGGLVADIFPPDHKTRLAILECKSKMLKTSFEASVMDFLATHFHHSVRELEGALIRLATYSRLNNSQLDLESVKYILNDLISITKQNSGHYQPPAIIQAVADCYGISPDDITGKKRDLKTSRARHIAMYLLRQQNHCTLTDIGRALGNRDHSTVIHGCEKISSQIGVDSQLSKSIEDIRLLLKSYKTA